MTVVNVVHAAPLRHVRKGSRVARLDWMRQVTPVRLREVDPKDMEPVAISYTARGERDLSFFGHDGRVWVQPSFIDWERGPNAVIQQRPVTPAELVGYLENRDGHARIGSLEGAFTWTPVRPSGASERIGRGLVRELFASREVLHDGAGEAARLLRDYVEDNVRVAGDRVFVRSLQPLLAYSLGNKGSWQPWLRNERSGSLMRFYRIDRTHDACRIEQSLLGEGRVPDLKEIDVYARSYFHEDDILAQVRMLPLMLDETISQAMNRYTKAGREHFIDEHRGIALRARLESFQPWVVPAMMGGIGLAQAPDVIAACEGVIQGFRRALQDRGLPGGSFWFHADTVRRFHEHDLPRLLEAGHVAAPTEEDAQAFAGLDGP